MLKKKNHLIIKFWFLHEPIFGFEPELTNLLVLFLRICFFFIRPDIFIYCFFFYLFYLWPLFFFSWPNPSVRRGYFFFSYTGEKFIGWLFSDSEKNCHEQKKEKSKDPNSQLMFKLVVYFMSLSPDSNQI